MKTIITVLDRITETSMPFNEFVVYRTNHYKKERNILIIFGKENKVNKIEIPQNLKTIYINKKIIKLRKIILELIKNETDKDGFVIHLHQVKSGFATQVALLFTGLRKKTIFTVHSTFSGYSLHNKILSFLTAMFSFYVTCVSKSSYDKYPGIIKKAKKNKIMIIQNGVDTERIDCELSNNNRKEDESIKFIYVARIIPIKCHKFLINVIKKSTTNASFIFVGDDKSKYAKKIKRMCKENKIENKVTFTGMIPRNKVFEYLQRSDVYISSSTLEGMPISVLEAAYAKLPLIISDIPQHKELANMESYISVLPFDTNIWVDEINKYALMNSKKREEIGLKSREYVLKNFSLEKMHIYFSNLYNIVN